MTSPRIIAVAADAGHNFSKPVKDSITLIKGMGVEGDAHAGKIIQHLYDKARNPDAPNLRQVHLIHAELHDALAENGFTVGPGEMGENITTRGIDLLGLPRGTRLKIGNAVIEVTGLRNPCKKLNAIQDGLLHQLIEPREGWKKPYPLTGVMGVILQGGDVKAGDEIDVILPDEPHEELRPV